MAQCSVSRGARGTNAWVQAPRAAEAAVGVSTKFGRERVLLFGLANVGTRWASARHCIASSCCTYRSSQQLSCSCSLCRYIRYAIDFVLACSVSCAGSRLICTLYIITCTLTRDNASFLPYAAPRPSTPPATLLPLREYMLTCPSSDKHGVSKYARQPSYFFRR